MKAHGAGVGGRHSSRRAPQGRRAGKEDCQPPSLQWASLIAQLVKNPPAMQETPFRFLGWEDPLEKGIGYPLQYSWASLVAQLVKNLPAMRVQLLGWGDPLEKGKATHSSILAWRIPWTV